MAWLIYVIAFVFILAFGLLLQLARADASRLPQGVKKQKVKIVRLRK